MFLPIPSKDLETFVFNIFRNCPRQWNFAFVFRVNALSAKITKWSDTLKQFVGKLPTNCLSVFDNFVGLALKELMTANTKIFCRCRIFLIPYAARVQ